MQCGNVMYEERVYRELIKSEELHRCTVVEEETDLLIVTSKEFNNHEEIRNIRNTISEYILRREEFQTSLEPIAADEFAPKIIRHMIESSKAASVGPMATVAGCVSEYLGKSLTDDEIMIENGGDIYLKSNNDKVIAIYAGESRFSNKVGIKIKSEDTPIGICTSAGKIGHSLSLGSTDAVVVISEDTLLADATATAIGNIVKSVKDIRKGLEFGLNIRGILGIVIIIDEELGACGQIELVGVGDDKN